MKKFKRVLIIMGHPSGNSLSFSLANAYEAGAKDALFDVKRININELEFDPILHEGYNKRQELERDLIGVCEKILWAEHIVWIFPVWWGGPPTLLCGFIDRVFLPRFAFKYVKGRILPRGLLRGKSSSIINTSGSNGLMYFLFIKRGIKLFKRVVLNFCGIYSVRQRAFNSIRDISNERATGILKKMKKMGYGGF